MAPAEAQQHKRPQGFFFELIGGNPYVLYQDHLAHPDRYEDVVVKILEELVSRSRKVSDLSAEELELLHQATALFASEVTRPVPRTVPKRPAPKQTQEEEPEETSDDDLGALRPYWWL